MAVGGWWNETFGALNAHEGEYDTNQYFTVVVGIPVWLWYRGSYHVVDANVKRPAEVDQRLYGFHERYRELLTAPPPGGNQPGMHHAMRIGEVFGSLFAIPLRRRAAYGWMALFYFIVWSFGLGAASAVLSLLRLANRALPMTQRDINFMIGAWGCFAVFIPLLALYRWVRRPSARQRGIREVTRAQLGPFSDPAEWLPPLAARVLSDEGVDNAETNAVLLAAERQLGNGDVAGALVLVRLAIALAGPDNQSDCARAEEVTDDCLARI